MKQQNEKIEQAISSRSRVVNATKSMIRFHDFENDRLAAERRLLTEELNKTTSPAITYELRQALAENKVEQSHLDKGWANSSLRRRLSPGQKYQPVEQRFETRLLTPSESLLMTEPVQSEHRAKEKKTIYGYAAIFDTVSVDLGFFVEKISKGAFSKVLQKSDLDCRALFNHNPDALLARTDGQTGGTLRLYQDKTGLAYYADLISNDGLSEGVAARVQRGDLSGCSFSFIVKKDSWTFAQNPGETDLRIIEEISELFDVGPVTYPAYPDTTVGVETKSIDRAGDTYDEESAGLDRLKAAKKRLVKLDYERAGRFISLHKPRIERARQREINRKYRYAGRIINRNKSA